MNNKIYTILFVAIFLLGGNMLAQAQTTYFPIVTIEQSSTQVAKEIPLTYNAEDYSDITYIGNNQYAVVSDKKDGFYIFTIPLKSDGSIDQITRSNLYQNSATSKDCEGIIFHPGRNSVFISREADQKIKEYNLNTGVLTGTELNIPAIFSTSNGTGNYGFESLGYNATTGLFWTTTESTLAIDGTQASYINKTTQNLLRLQSFGANFNPVAQYAYKMDLPTTTATTVTQYAFGVPAITALPDGRLLVMEREFYVGAGLAVTASFVNIKIYLVNPTLGTDVTSAAALSALTADKFLQKELLKEFKTTFVGIANYEGMCLGPQNADGTYPLLLINDSQSRYMGALNEYVLPLTLRLTDTRSADSSLGNILIDGATIDGFNSGIVSYSDTVDCDQESVTLSAIPTDNNASVNPAGSFTARLNPGGNSFQFVVTAENQTTKTYTVNVIRTCAAPKIIVDLKDAVVCEGNKHTFELIAEGDNIRYEWFYGNNRIENANGNKYTIENVQKSDYGVYSVIVRTTQGNQSSASSKAVTLSVANQLPPNLLFAECPNSAVVGKAYTIKLGGYSNVTKYTWSFSQNGASFSPEVGTGGQNETKVTFGASAVGTGILKVSLEHPCGTRELTQSIIVKYPTGTENVTATIVQVYPNPTSGILKVSGTELNQQIRILDITGSLKGTYKTMEGTTMIDLTGYTKGTYMVQYNGNTYKVIKK